MGFVRFANQLIKEKKRNNHDPNNEKMSKEQK